MLHGGLALLKTVLLDTTPEDSDQDRLVATMQRSIASSYIPLDGLEGIFGEAVQRRRRQQTLSARDTLTTRRAPLPFHGDYLAGPPLAWTLLWGGTYSNLVGWYIPDELRRWAYVLWDADRLELQGGRGVLQSQWDECWEHDPRDDLS